MSRTWQLNKGERVFLLKVDVEGMEADVLEGAAPPIKCGLWSGT
jgi:FkbM family methyltransferase